MNKARGIAICVLVLMCSSMGWSDIVYDDPATIHVGPGPCGAASLTGCGGDPNVIGNTGLVTLYQNSGGNIGTPLSPVLLILAVANATNPNLFSSSSISSVSFQNPLGNTSVAGSSTYGGGYGLSSSGYQGSMTSGDIYTFLCGLGLQPGGGCSGVNNSNNFGNLSTALLANNGVTATGFGIYVFQLFGTLGSNGLVTVQFANNALPGGTFVVGYAQTSKQKGPNTNITIFTTPFTEAGLTTNPPPPPPPPPPVPEPGTLVLLGSGLVGAAGVLKRHFC